MDTYNDALGGVARNITGLGVGSSHTINVAFDGFNTKFKVTYENGTLQDFIDLHNFRFPSTVLSSKER